MHNLTPAQVDELLQLIASAIKSYHSNKTDAIVNWMRENAQSYLN